MTLLELAVFPKYTGLSQSSKTLEMAGMSQEQIKKVLALRYVFDELDSHNA